MNTFDEYGFLYPCKYRWRVPRLLYYIWHARLGDYEKYGDCWAFKLKAAICVLLGRRRNWIEWPSDVVTVAGWGYSTCLGAESWWNLSVSYGWWNWYYDEFQDGT